MVHKQRKGLPYEWFALDGLEASFRACQEINSEMMSLRFDVPLVDY